MNRKPKTAFRGMKAAGTAAAAAAVAVSLALGTLFASPGELMDAAPLSMETETLSGDFLTPADVDPMDTEDKRQVRRGIRGRVSAFFQALPDGLKLAVLTPLWFCARVLLSLAAGGMSLLKEPVLAFAGNLLLLLLLGMTAFKLINPDKSLKAFFSRRRLGILAVCALLIGAVDCALPLLPEKYGAVAKLVRTVTAAAVAAGGFILCRRGRRALRHTA